MGWLTFLSISMYCLNKETRSWRGRFRVSDTCLFIYRIQRFLFLRIDSPIIWDYLNDKSFPSVSAIVSIFLPALSVCPYTVEGPSHGRGAYGHNVWHNARRILSLGSSLVYFSPPHHPLSSLLRSLISVIEHRTRTRSQCSARSVHIRNGTRVVSLYTRFYTLPSFVLRSPLSSRLSRCMQIRSTNLLSARASVLGGR